MAGAFTPIPLFPLAGGRIAGNGAGPAAAVSAIFYRHRFRGFITRLDTLALALTWIGFGVAGITFTRVRRRVGGVRTVLAFLLIGVFLTRALVGTFARVCRRIAGARAGIGCAHTRIG